MKVGDKVWLSAAYYGAGKEHLSGTLLQKAVPNVVWGTEPYAPVLWEVRVKDDVFKVWDYLLEINNENR